MEWVKRWIPTLVPPMLMHWSIWTSVVLINGVDPWWLFAIAVGSVVGAVLMVGFAKLFEEKVDDD